MNKSYADHIRAMMLIGQKIIFSASSSSKQETGAVNAKSDHSLVMDVTIETAFIDYIHKENLPFRIYSEEAGDVKDVHPNPEFVFSTDPLDGSANYKFGKGRLPYGSLLSIYKGLTPTLNDVVAAGVIEYTMGDFFIFDGEKTVDGDSKQVILDHSWKVHKTTPVYLDLFYKEGVGVYESFAEEVFIRGSGSVVGNLVYTLLNISAVMGGISVRAEEIGAVYALIKGAGGVTLDHFGIPIDEKLFNQSGCYPLVAGNEKIARFMIRKMMHESGLPVVVQKK